MRKIMADRPLIPFLLGGILVVLGFFHWRMTSEKRSLEDEFVQTSNQLRATKMSLEQLKASVTQANLRVDECKKSSDNRVSDLERANEAKLKGVNEELEAAKKASLDAGTCQKSLAAKNAELGTRSGELQQCKKSLDEKEREKNDLKSALEACNVKADQKKIDVQEESNNESNEGNDEANEEEHDQSQSQIGNQSLEN